MEEKNKCLFCGSDAKCVFPSDRDDNQYDCKFCGKYVIVDSLDIETLDVFKDEVKKFKIACVLNERKLKKREGIVFSDNLEHRFRGLSTYSETELLDSFPKNASELLDRTLLNLERLTSQPFSEISLNGKQIQLNLFTDDLSGCHTILNELSEDGLILFNLEDISNGDFSIVIKSKGWETIEKLKNTNIESKQAFVAMWFDDSMNDFYKDGIKKAIEEAGYSSVRIDGKDFNGKICDEIIAEIRRSKFLIADFTGQRGGVYFEAGFAHGLGREVIFTVKEKDVDNLHFDTRQYNHIVYDTPEDLYKQLLNRIRATII